MASIAASITDPGIRKVVKAAFPDYRGRKIAVCPSERPVDVRSYWSGGSRSYFAAIRLTDMGVMGVPQNGTPFDGGPIAPNGVVVPSGCAIVEHEYFCGKDVGIRIHVNPDAISKLLAGRG